MVVERDKVEEVAAEEQEEQEPDAPSPPFQRRPPEGFLERAPFWLPWSPGSGRKVGRTLSVRTRPTHPACGGNVRT